MAARNVLKYGIMLIAVAAAVLGAALMTPPLRAPSICETKPKGELIDLHPELQELVERHRLETERLLTRHRIQDVTINMLMSSQSIDPEEALRLSMGQVDELAELRRRQDEEFKALCRQLSSAD